MKLLPLILLCALCWPSIGWSQSKHENPRPVSERREDFAANKIKKLRQQKLGKWKIQAGDYSGITWMGGNRYAVVSDKEQVNGFIRFSIDINPRTGKIEQVQRADTVCGLQTDRKARDCEGIAYFPENGTFFISGESDQRILEYDVQGKPTGRELAVPSEFGTDHIVGNYGFEALTYSADTHRFWCTTESQLKSDGEPAGPEHPGMQNLMRLQSFGDDLQPKEQYAYRMDACRATERAGAYAYGISDILALPDGKLLVMEREFYVAKRFVGSWVMHNIYKVDPSTGTPVTFKDKAETLGEEKILKKELVAQFKTKLKLGSADLANYEGMCLGPKLNDGRQTILLINDSQHNFGNRYYHLKDYLRVLIF